MHPSYYHEAHACILVFDVTRKVTYKNLLQWYKVCRGKRRIAPDAARASAWPFFPCQKHQHCVCVCVVHSLHRLFPVRALPLPRGSLTSHRATR